MAYLFTFFVVLVAGLILYKTMRKRKLPNNQYTPYDDMTSGKTDGDKPLN